MTKRNRIAALMTAFVLFVAGILPVHAKEADPHAVVALDSGSAVEIWLDENGAVLNIAAANAEGETLLADVQWQGLSLGETVDVLVEGMLRARQIDDALLVSVYAQDEGYAQELVDLLGSRLNETERREDKLDEVYIRMAEESEQADLLTAEAGVSRAKAALALAVEQQNAQYSAQELAAMRVEKLVEIADRTIGVIGAHAAVRIALEHAGVTADQARGLQCEADRDGGRVVYEIEFECGGYEYEYEIGAADGTIYKADKERDD